MNILFRYNSLDTLKKKIATELKIPSEQLYKLWLNENYIKAELGEITSEEYFDYFSQKVNLSWSYKKWIKEWSNICESNKNGQILFNQLKAKGHQICILSNLAKYHKLGAELKYPGFWQMANRNFLSYELGMLKPDPEIFKTVCSQLNKTPNECIFFDDREENVISAKEVGLMAFQFCDENLENITKEIEHF